MLRFAVLLFAAATVTNTSRAESIAQIWRNESAYNFGGQPESLKAFLGGGWPGFSEEWIVPVTQADVGNWFHLDEENAVSYGINWSELNAALFPPEPRRIDREITYGIGFPATLSGPNSQIGGLGSVPTNWRLHELRFLISEWGLSNPTNTTLRADFRILAVVPEPTGAVLVILCCGCLLMHRHQNAPHWRR